MNLSVLLLAASLMTQPTGQPADPVSGQWGSDSTPLLDMTLDGAGRITGTIFLVTPGERTSAPIAKGTFDAKTRALRLEGEVRRANDTTVPYVITATVDGDTLQASYRFGSDEGDLTMKKLK